MSIKFHRRAQKFLSLAVITLTIGSTATAANVYTEQRRNNDNAARLQKLNPYMRPKVRAVLDDLEGHGHRPLIDAAVWRSPAEQAALVRKGHSKVYYSYHTANSCDGKPKPCTPKADSLAADITDVRWFWQSPKPYWIKQARSAEAHNLTTGIMWGLSTTNRAKLRKAIDTRNFNYTGPLGWDVAHVEIKGVSLNQAKAGKRLK